MAVKTRPEARSPGRRGQGLPVSRERRLPPLHMSESTSDGRDPPGSKGPDAEPYSPPSRLAELNKGAAEDLRNLGFDSQRHREVSATDTTGVPVRGAEGDQDAGPSAPGKLDLRTRDRLNTAGVSGLDPHRPPSPARRGVGRVCQSLQRAPAAPRSWAPSPGGHSYADLGDPGIAPTGPAKRPARGTAPRVRGRCVTGRLNNGTPQECPVLTRVRWMGSSAIR
jgi:hypothetical protein